MHGLAHEELGDLVREFTMLQLPVGWSLLLLAVLLWHGVPRHCGV